MILKLFDAVFLGLLRPANGNHTVKLGKAF